MSEDIHSIEYTLGQLSGKMDGILGSVNTVSATFTAHALSDEHNFAELRKRMDEDKKEATSDRIRVAKMIGGTVVVTTILSYIIPIVINKFLAQ